MTKCVWIAMPGDGDRVLAQKPRFGAITDTCRGVVNRPESTDLGQDHGNMLQPVFLIEAFWRLAV